MLQNVSPWRLAAAWTSRPRLACFPHFPAHHSCLFAANWNPKVQLQVANTCVCTCSVMVNSFWPHGLSPTRLLCPWNFPGKNTGMSCHFLHQGIFLTQGLKRPFCLLYWQAGSLPVAQHISWVPLVCHWADPPWIGPGYPLRLLPPSPTTSNSSHSSSVTTLRQSYALLSPTLCFCFCWPLHELSLPSFWIVTNPLSAYCFQGPRIRTLGCQIGVAQALWTSEDPPGIWVESKGTLEGRWVDRSLFSVLTSDSKFGLWFVSCRSGCRPGEDSLCRVVLGPVGMWKWGTTWRNEVFLFFSLPTNGLRTVFPGEPLKPAWELTEGVSSGFQSHNCYNTQITHGLP